MELMPCPHISVDEHIRACVGGSVTGLLVIGLINLPSISRFISRKSRNLFSSTSSQQMLTKREKTTAVNGTEVDQKERGGNQKERRSNEGRHDYKLNLVDHLLGAMLLAIMAINVYTRMSRGVTHWLVQVSNPLLRDAGYIHPKHLIQLSIVTLLCNEPHSEQIWESEYAEYDHHAIATRWMHALRFDLTPISLFIRVDLSALPLLDCDADRGDLQLMHQRPSLLVLSLRPLARVHCHPRG